MWKKHVLSLFKKKKMNKTVHLEMYNVLRI